MKHVVLLILFLHKVCVGHISAQQAIEIGPAFGISFPKPILRNMDIDRIKPGAIIGVNLDMVRKSWVKDLYFNTGVYINGFLFEQTPSHNFKGTAVGLYGLSFGFPFKLQHHIMNDRDFILRYTIGVLPLWESKALVRNNDPDGGLRFNAGPEVSISMLVEKSNSVGFRWFMPLREYGAQEIHNTFYLLNFSFFASWTLKGHSFAVFEIKPRKNLKRTLH